MYVTVTHDGTGQLAVHGPVDATTGDIADTAVVTVVCPPGAVDRMTGALSHPYQFATIGHDLVAVPVRPPATATVSDLNALTVAVCIHPFSLRMLVVGLFTGPDRAEQWWQDRFNRMAAIGAHCHILPLTGPTASSTGPITGEPA